MPNVFLRKIASVFKYLLFASLICGVSGFMLKKRTPVWQITFKYSVNPSLGESVKNILSTKEGLRKFLYGTAEIKKQIQDQKLSDEELQKKILVQNKAQVLNIQYYDYDQKLVNLFGQNIQKNLNALIEYYELRKEIDFDGMSETDIKTILVPSALSCYDNKKMSCDSYSGVFKTYKKDEPLPTDIQDAYNTLKERRYVDLYFKYLIQTNRLVAIQNPDQSIPQAELAPTYFREYLIIIFCFAFVFFNLMSDWFSSRKKE